MGTTAMQQPPEPVSARDVVVPIVTFFVGWLIRSLFLHGFKQAVLDAVKGTLDERFTTLAETRDQRFDDLEKSLDERFAAVNREIDLLAERRSIPRGKPAT